MQARHRSRGRDLILRLIPLEKSLAALAFPSGLRASGGREHVLIGNDVAQTLLQQPRADQDGACDADHYDVAGLHCSQCVVHGER